MFITVEMHHQSLWKGSILLAFPGFLHASPQTFGLGVVSLQHQKLSVSLSAVNLVYTLCGCASLSFWKTLFFFFQTSWSTCACIQGKKELERLNFVIWIACRSDKENGKSLSSFVIGMVYYCCKRPDCWLHLDVQTSAWIALLNVR